MDRVRGIVKWFNDEKGYGFISFNDGKDDAFAHFAHIKGEGFKTLADGEEVEFTPVNGARGYHAHDIVVLNRVNSNSDNNERISSILEKVANKHKMADKDEDEESYVQIIDLNTNEVIIEAKDIRIINSDIVHTCGCGTMYIGEPKYVTNYGDLCSEKCLEELIVEVIGVEINVIETIVKDDN